MATPSITQGTSILTHQAVTHPDTVKGTAQDVSTKISATIFCFHSPIEAAANTNPGKFLVQISASSSGDEDWATVQEFQVDSGTAATEALTATEPAGETVLAVASTTDFAAGDWVYIQDAGTLADSEWGKLQEIVTNVSLNLIDGLTTGKDSSDVAWGQAEVFVASLDLMAIGRLRVVFQHEGAAGANCHVKAMMVTCDSFA